MNTDEDVVEGTDFVLASLMAAETDAGQADDLWISNPVLSRHWDRFTLDHLAYMPDEAFSQTLQQWSRYKQQGCTNSNFEDLLEQIEHESAQGPFPDDGGVNQQDDTGERSAVTSDYQDEIQTDTPIVTIESTVGKSRAAKIRARIANIKYQEKLKASRESHASSAAASVPEEGNDDDDAGPAAKDDDA
ncbi:hypothetical protein I350_05541 [Cryptococcus amylolentus CBS 6273]|uniref:Uncharacterized protein n=1 Tax=Cryptococcus amylolentus CBS 6273 TaxID=1296118 RepID=A0A1E3JVW1_9TREE|nr:hypothetical protein I350_05541 [Cryptococcus amylolentus CBS 6273]